MDVQPLVKRPRQRRTRVEVERVLLEFESSGLTQREFCQLHHLSLSTLSRYRQRHRERSEAPSSAPRPRWVAVEVVESGQTPSGSAGSGLAIALPAGLRIEVALGFDTNTLQQLLRTLERL